MFVSGLRRDRRAAVSIIFATTIIPLAMSVGLAVDYSFFIQCQSQLSLAADAGAIHAVRIASANFIAGQTSAQADTDGGTAGVQWFNAQLGTLNTGTILPADIHISVTYDAATSKFTSVVNYKATVPTHFGGLFKVYSWPVYGVANAVITTNSYVEIAMLLDNSSSMLIGTGPADILAIEHLTVCPPTSMLVNQPNLDSPHTLSEYSYPFNTGIGYAPSVPPGPSLTLPTAARTPNGKCDKLFTGPANQCPDPASLTVGSLPQLPTAGILPNGQCPAGTGLPQSLHVTGFAQPVTVNVPMAPCGFACHTPFYNGAPDYYALVRNPLIQPPISLRFDVIQSAVGQIIKTLEQDSQINGQFTVGLFDFNSAVGQIYPATGNVFTEAGPDLDAAQTQVALLQPPSVADQPNTNFPGAMQYLAANFKATGDGSTPATPRKNMFIITDGLEDYSQANRFIGGMSTPSPGMLTDNCAALKALGVNIYVLYTPYYPLPNPFYLAPAPPNNAARLEVEPLLTSNVVAGLKACATQPQYYYQASSAADINTALQKMLQSALNTPGRLSL